MEGDRYKSLDPKWVARCRVWAGWLFVASGAVGYLAMLGWPLDSAFLTSLFPGWPSMKFNCTWMVQALAVAGWIQNRRQARHAGVDGLAVIVFLFALGTLAQYALQRDFGIDALFWRHPRMLDGRMSIASAMSFALLAFGLWGARRPAQKRLAQLLVVVASTICAVAVIGFFFGLETLRSFYPFHGMSVQSALSLGGLGLGVLLSDARYGLMAPFASRYIGSWALRRLFLITSGVVVGVSWVITEGKNFGHYDANMAVCLSLVATIGFLYAGMAKWSEWANRLDVDRDRSLGDLEESERETRAMLDGLPQLIWVADEEGRPVYANRHWLVYTGMDITKDGGSWHSRCVHPEDFEIFSALRTKALRTQTPFEMEFRIRRDADGAFRWHICRAQPLRRQGGRVTQWLASATDVDDQRRLESERSAVRIREAALEESSRLKMEFLVNMSHEIRTPLHGVVGMAEALADTSLSEEQRKLMKSIRSSADTLALLVNDVLDLAKLEQGKMELENLPFSLHDTLVELTENFRFAAEKKGLRFHADFSGAPDSLRGDSLRLRQVLSNLLANAVRFTEVGEISLSVKGAAGHWVAFAVEDTGVGIPASAKDRLFQPFSQVDPSTTRRYGGSGLGLRISKEIVERMGGRIGFESEVGKGSRFWFEVELPAVESAMGAGAVEGPKWRPNILVAEDNETSQHVVSLMLRSLNCDVTCVGDGQAAVDAVLQGAFDLLFLDCQMPVMDGYTAAQNIREAGRLLPIVALTASTVRGDRERCLSVGMNDYMSKPARQAQIAAMLQRWLGEDGIPAPLREICATPDGAAAAREIAEVFRRRTPERLATIERALAGGDATAVAREAHSLKSAAAYVGAGSLSRLCATLEARASGGELPECEGAVDEMRRELDRFGERLSLL